MALQDLLQDTGEWLRGTGPESDIVISSRVRLARNVQNFHFITKMEADERAACEEKIRKQILAVAIVPETRYVELLQTEPLDRKLLVERHLISKEHEDGRHARGLAVGVGENLAIMVNEEDHIRLQALQSGYQLRPTWALADQVDTKLEQGLDYAFSSQLGYLTACPTNVGTGMRVSVMLHLPALVLTRHIEKVFQAVSKINLAVRGLYGEGTEASGHFYQISNQVTLGKTEEEILANVENVIPTIVSYERRAREDLMKKDRARLEDRVWKAYGLLKYARVITSEESMMLLSSVRMGVHLGILPGLNLRTVNDLFIHSQPAHLQRLSETVMEPNERDIRRATFIRSKLAEA